MPASAPPSWDAQRDRALLALEQMKDAAAREEAALRLCELCEADLARAAELASHLPRLLADASEAVRRAGVCLAAQTLPPEEAEPFFAARLKDAAWRVRLEATGQLADLARPSARGILAGALEDAVPNIRFEAARGMAALGHPAGLEILVGALDDGMLRFRALGALGLLGDARALPDVQRVFRRWFLPAFERTQAAGVLARLGDAAGAQHLLKRARRRRWNLDRALAIELCGEVKVDGAYALLTGIVQDAEHSCRGAAARGLGRLGNPDALPLLLAVFESGCPEEDRLDAAEGVLRLRAQEGRALLSKGAGALGPSARSELTLMLEGT